jgi:phosphomannomutase
MQSQIQRWLSRDRDEQTRQELQQLVAAGDQDELRRRFAGRLGFGTAGLRGLLGVGTAYMNRLVVQETSAGLGAYLCEQQQAACERGVVVGFDGRRRSRIFAEDTACVLGALGFRVHLFDEEAPTPLCAYAVKELGAAAGVVITASHNPPEYNGYKVYWSNGAQIIPPHDTGIAAHIEHATQKPLPWEELASLRRRGRIASLGGELAQRYLEGVAALSVHARTEARGQLRIAYTPLHGVGARLAEHALARAGFSQVRTVASQREPDGSFPTVCFPNPEEPGAMDAVLALARQMKADLACANDPDADRFAVAVRTPEGDYRLLTGDQVGALLGDDRLRHAPADSVVATTVVSSQLLPAIARRRGAACFVTLTGFKWLANGAIERRTKGEEPVFAYEEALGYNVGSLVWDKDGISALVAFAELAAHCRQRGHTVLERLEELHRQHGLHVTAQRSIRLQPLREGPTVGERLRAAPPHAIAGRAVLSCADLLTGERRRCDGIREALCLPRSDVLVYHLDGAVRVIVRPSGTEPKLKCYYELVVPMPAQQSARHAEQRASEELGEVIAAHQEELSVLNGKTA